MSLSSGPEVTVIVVNHRSAAEARPCLASLREAFEREAIEGEILLVDCGSGPAEARELEALGADRLIVLEENRGYSGGINAGLARARGKNVFLSNPDVVYHSNALTELLREISDPLAGAAAPLALWDAEGRIRLPPGFAPGFWRDLSQRLAGSWPAIDERRFRACARETLRLWSHGGPTRHLSGAVLAVRREVLDRVGHFDERFPLEYEETEWEERVRRAGFQLRFVPRARVRHLWARSSSRNPAAAARRAVSERLYRDRRYGRAARLLLEKASTARRAVFDRLAEPRVEAVPGAMLAISPNRSRLPFAGADLSRDFELPAEIAANLPGGPWYFTVFDAADGRPLSTSVWNKVEAA